MHGVAELIHHIFLRAGAAPTGSSVVGREELLVGPSLSLLGEATLVRHRASCLVTPVHLAIVSEGGVAGERMVAMLHRLLPVDAALHGSLTLLGVNQVVLINEVSCRLLLARRRRSAASLAHSLRRARAFSVFSSWYARSRPSSRRPDATVP